MVYESDFYTTRRPYRPLTSTYSTSRRSQVDWEKVPFVPRPSLVPEPVTAWGKRRTDGRTRPEVKEVLRAARAAPPPPEPLAPLPEYESARDATRRRVMVALQRYSEGARDPPVDTPRHYVVEERLGAPRRAEENYSYSYNSTSERRSDSSPYSYTPAATSYSSTTERRTTSRGGPGESYSYNSERSSRLGGPGAGYSSSYSTTTSGRLPHGTTYRHYSYRV